MSIVVSDTGPINYLTILGIFPLLQNLYKSVFITPQILKEMSHKSSPTKVKNLAKNLPNWVKVKNIKVLDEISVYRLDAGELEAISLAKKLNLPVLLDDLDARKVADLYKISKVGTLGILVELSNKKLVNIDATLKKLKKTNFFLSKDLEHMVRNLCS
mgnify:CR=1 FL=1